MLWGAGRLTTKSKNFLPFALTPLPSAALASLVVLLRVLLVRQQRPEQRNWLGNPCGVFDPVQRMAPARCEGSLRMTADALRMTLTQKMTFCRTAILDEQQHTLEERTAIG